MRLLNLFEQPNQGLWFHASPREFGPSSLKPMSHLGSEKAALERGHGMMRLVNKYDFFVYVYQAHPKKSATMTDFGGQHDAVQFARVLRKSEPPAIGVIEYTAVIGGRTETIRMERLQQALLHNGYDSIMYRNIIEDAGSMSMVVVDPSILTPVRVDKYENGVYVGEVGELV